MLKLSIAKTATVGETQDAFHAAFPYLKIMFFTRPHREYKGSNAKFLVTDRSMAIADVAGFAAEGELTIEPQTRTWEVEKMIADETGLSVQIFRKSGNIWLETSVSDDLTLEQQNEKAREQETYERPIADPLDYREMD